MPAPILWRAVARAASCLALAVAGTVLHAAPRVDIVSVDLSPLIDRAAKSPSQFAVDIPHPASSATDGEWSTSGNVSTWTYSTQIPGAVSMSFHASQVVLPDSATLTVTANGVRYPYTARDISDGGIWSRIGRGDSLAFELKVPTRDASGVRFTVASLQAGYRAFGVGAHNHPHYDKLRIQSLGDTAELSSCTENWSCNTTPTNDGPGNATVALIVSNMYQCTGVLLNDVPGDDTPYVLTARHCENTSSDGGQPSAAASVRVYWNAVAACGAPMGTIYDAGIVTQYGAQTVVEQQDAWLIRLNQPPAVDAYYAGWDATGATFTGGFTAHHALGGSRQFIEWFGQAAYLTLTPEQLQVHYTSTVWGTVNAKGSGGGGASGAGLFDPNGRLVGTVVRGDDSPTDHTGVCPVASPPAPAYSTATTLSTAFSGIFESTDDPQSTTGSVTIQSVLDPNHTGQKVIDGKKRAITVTLTGGYSNASMPTGATIQLQWVASPGAQTCTASGGQSDDGWQGPLDGTIGSKSITAIDAGDVTYTVSCTDGQRTGTASVTVHWTLGAPSASLYFLSGTGEYGVPSVLRWNSNLRPCVASGGSAGDGWSGALASNGTASVTETVLGSVTYTITCGSGTRVASSQTLQYIYAPTASVEADAATLLLDQPLYITLQRTGGPCTRTGGGPGDGWAGSLPTNNSTHYMTVTINESTPGTYTYGLSCGSGSHVASSQATVTFVTGAPAASIQASPSTARVTLDTVTVSWDSNVRPCDVSYQSMSYTGPFVSSATPHGSASQQSGLIDQVVYSIKCGSGANVAQASATVNWTGTPAVQLDAPLDAVKGQAFGVDYQSNILPCTLSGGTTGDGWGGQNKQASYYVTVTEQSAGTQTYTVTCGSGAQTATATKTVNVVAQAPSVTLTVDHDVQQIGKTVTLTWSSNTQSCQLQGGHTGDGWTGNVAGSGSVTLTESDDLTYVFNVTCHIGSLTAGASQFIKYSVYALPTFTASKTSVTPGESFTLNWASADGAACVATGGLYGDGWAAARAASGSADMKESDSGSYDFYLQCNPAPTVHVQVVVIAVPAVTLATNSSSATVGDGVVLTWTAKNSNTCTAGGGNQTDGWSGDLASSGGQKVITETASGTYVYSITCAGPSNTSASANVTVTMNAAATPPPPPPPTTPPPSTSSSSDSGGGGGGAMSAMDLAFLLAFASLGWQSRRRVRRLRFHL